MSATVFDAHAAGYDSVAESSLGRELRSRVRTVLSEFTAADDVVLDLGCGTGIDAAWLAPQVRSVIGVDASAQMTELTHRRCSGLDNVTVVHADAATFQPDEPVDVVLANFGVVNCVGDLSSFGARLVEMLAPGGHAVLVSMSRWCPVELALAAATGNLALLRRRQMRPSSSTPTSTATSTPTPTQTSTQTSTQTPTQTSTPTQTGYQGLELQYAAASDLQVAFDQQLVLVHSESLGLVLPPFEQRSWVESRPRLLSGLANLDQRLGRLGARARLGDHHIAVFQAAG